MGEFYAKSYKKMTKENQFKKEFADLLDKFNATLSVELDNNNQDVVIEFDLKDNKNIYSSIRNVLLKQNINKCIDGISIINHIQNE